MWSRVVEVSFGCWLLMSPFIFHHRAEAWALWANDFGCGAAIIVFGLLSYWRPMRFAHLLSIGVAAWLIVFAYGWGWGQPVPASQNDMVVGLLLLMFAIIPNQASQPPVGWREPAMQASDMD